MELFRWLVVCLLACAVAEQIDLELNKAPAIASDIKRIYHDPALRQVVIDLKVKRRCNHPSFMVRMSGASLYLLDPQQQNETAPASLLDNKHFQKFSYPPIMDQGLHFIEVVVLHCQRFLPHTYRELCLEKTTSGANILNMPYSFSATPTTFDASTVPRPRWILPNGNTPAVLTTRHQAFVEGEDHGRNVEDLTLHNMYDFVDLPPLAEKLQAVLNLSHAKPGISVINVCMVGCSHANGIVGYGKGLVKAWDTVNFVHILSRYPHQFDLQAVENAECSYAVVGYGQWPFSEFSNYTAEHYTHEVDRMVKSIAAYTGKVQFFTWSMNYNPMGDIFQTCPPQEFRTPPVVDMANQIMKLVTFKHNVEFIDLNFIMGPLWDSAYDWCHPSNKIYTAEAHWILKSMFESSLRLKRSVRFDPPPIITENEIIRFTGSTTVYLMQNSTLRAFPNGATFLKMGFEFDNVRALWEVKKRHCAFGKDLPRL